MNDSMHLRAGVDELGVVCETAWSASSAERQRRRRTSRMLALALAVLLCLSVSLWPP